MIKDRLKDNNAALKNFNKNSAIGEFQNRLRRG